MLAEQDDKNDKAAVDFYEAALKLPANEAYTKEYKAFAYSELIRIAARAKAYYRNALDTAECKRPFAKRKRIK